MDQLKLFIAPVFLGDEALPFAQIKKTLKLKKTTVEELRQDLLMTALIEQPTHPQIDTEAGRSKDKKLQKKIEVSKARKSKKTAKAIKPAENKMLTLARSGINWKNFS